MCDTIGPRWTFAIILLSGAVPTALAGAVTTAKGLLALRFFIGILGGSFIPCQVWTTGFFDKNVVGTANSFAAGLGNAGGGITYFVMPAIFDSLVHRQGLTEHVAWRVTFIVPFILITATALVMIFTCPDCPAGKWSARRYLVEQQLAARDTFLSSVPEYKGGASMSLQSRATSNDTLKESQSTHRFHHEAHINQEDDLLNAASWELVDKPTYHGSTKAVLSWPTFTVIAAYFCSFGAELCINSILGSYYLQKFPKLGQTGTGDWAAMFGLLNAVFRPAGGIISDAIYRSTGSLWGKKILLHSLAVMMGGFLLIIGILDSKKESVFFGLMVGLAFFLEASNGACFSLVPHVHPNSNGKHRSSLPVRHLLITNTP
jgi:NNP family nitrate/nitrite transporter-like MFS transporter